MCIGKDDQVETTQDNDLPQAPKPALPLIALLALASALGVAVAVALAGVAMLLAVPAYAEEMPRWLERDDEVVEAEPLPTECQSLEDGETLVVVCEIRMPASAVLEHVRFVERAAEIGPGAALVVELEYRLVPRGGGPRLLTMR